MQELRIPHATYRFQFHKDFRFVDVEPLVGYLHNLGISDLYASPILKSRQNSTHGYDVVDHGTLHPAIGSEEDFIRLTDRLKEHDMGLLMDVVPNHMGIDDIDNGWWQDVLENGPSSPYAKYFDIDWNPPKRDLRNRVLLPILGDQYGKVLENGEIQLAYERGAFYVHYYQRRFPIDPRTSRLILELAIEHLRYVLESDAPDFIELESIVTSLGYLPRRNERDLAKVEERQREKEVAKRRLSMLVETSGPVKRAVEAAVDELNGQKGDSASFDNLETLLAGQAYRLCFWRVASDEINYRRFFDINELAAIRVEEPEVFEAVHRVVLRLFGEGRVTGLRIDHPDGLFDPENYFLTLQAKCRAAITGGEFIMPKMPLKGLDCASYIAVEKILSHGERLPERWSVHGTTGYETLNLINGVFVDQSSRAQLLSFYNQVFGRRTDFTNLVYECKKLILDVSMSAELHVLARRLDRISEQHRWSRDFTFWSLHAALREVIACFPVYRTYIRRETTAVSEEDRRHIETAIWAAKRRNPATDPSVFDFIRSVLLLDEPEDISEEDRAERRHFVMRIQQLTGPVMAKGFEDTAFYRAYPLASLNEVGGEPQRFGVTLEEFHEQNLQRLEHWPYSMLASTTHDTKRSEDVRARINVLSEIPQEWIEAVGRWQSLNESRKAKLDGHDTPDANEEYLLYQTLVGVWPLDPMDDGQYEEFVQRIVNYMEKALHEAKVHTSWVSPNLEYDRAIAEFVRTVLRRDVENPFIDDLQRFVQRVEYPAMCNSLSQLLLKCTIPGLPDIYQGTELWTLTLVDPDNRRPVDFHRRKEMLAELQQRENESRDGLIDSLHTNWRDSRIKMYVMYKTLQLRRQLKQLFLDGSYMPLEAAGEKASHLVTFLRRHEDDAVLVAVPRWIIRLGGSPVDAPVWGDTRLNLPEDAPQRWQHVLTGRTLERDPQRGFSAAQLFEQFPVALLVAAR